MRTPKSNIEKSKVNRSNETSFKSKFSNQRKIILVLGMVNSNRRFNYNIKAKNYAKKFGQAMRDQRRIAALSKHGYKIYSLDNKHDPIEDKHCNANFNDSRKLLLSLKEQAVFPVALGADNIILDYFFVPVKIIIYIYI